MSIEHVITLFFLGAAITWPAFFIGLRHYERGVEARKWAFRLARVYQGESLSNRLTHAQSIERYVLTGRKPALNPTPNPTGES